MTDTKDINNNLAELPQKQALLRISADFELFYNGENKAFVTVTKKNHFETYAIKSGLFRSVLTSTYYAATKSAVGKQAIQEALDNQIELSAAKAMLLHGLVPELIHD